MQTLWRTWREPERKQGIGDRPERVPAKAGRNGERKRLFAPSLPRVSAGQTCPALMSPRRAKHTRLIMTTETNTVTVEKLEKVEHHGDWHDKPTRYAVRGPGQECQKFSTKKDAL